MDNFGGVNPNPGQTPQFDPNQSPTQPQQPSFVDPNATPAQSGFASVPMTDPNAMGPMPPQTPTPLQQPQINQIDTMLDPQPAPLSPPPTGSSKAKVIIFAIIAVVVLIGASVGAYFVGYSAGKSAGKTLSDAQYQAEQERLQAEKPSKDDTPDELDLSDARDPDYTADELLEGKVGETLVSADGFVMRVNNIERKYTPDDPDYLPDETKELVKVNFQMGNITKSKTMDVNNTPFRLVDSTGAEILPENNIASYEGKFDTTKLDPGTQSNASLVFAVTIDDKPLTFSRKQPYRISNQNKEVTFKTLVVVSE